MTPSATSLDASSDVLTLPVTPKPGQSLHLRVERLSAEGRGETRLLVEPTAGLRRQLRVLVPGALVGERVEVCVEQRKGTTLRTRLTRLVDPSRQRIGPRCPHFDRGVDADIGCGGCSLQMLGYQDQLATKGQRIEQLMREVGLDPATVQPVIGQADPWYYRNKMEYTFAPQPGGGLVLGLHPVGKPRAVVSLAQCYLLSPASSAMLPVVARWCADRGITAFSHRGNSGFLRTLTIREGKRTDERLVELTTSDDQNVDTAAGPREAGDLANELASALLDIAKRAGTRLTSVYWTQHHAVRGQPTELIERCLNGSAVLHEELHLAGGEVLRFEIHPRAFFQPNTRQAEVLYDQIYQAAGLAREDRRGRALDLYCGTGTIALCLAPRCETVLGIDLQPDAVDNARRNALFNDIDNARFITGDVGKVLAGELRDELTSVDLVVVDPPRTGLAPVALQHIQAIGAPRLVYVSCNPEALVRDLIELARFGYQARSIQPVDMFPQTAHIESVVRLDLTKEATSQP